MNKKIFVAFASEKNKKNFDELKEGIFSDKELYKILNNAIDKLKKNPQAGIKIQRKLWPKEYIAKYNITNLWKIDLHDGWRLIYTIETDEVMILTIILDWLNHKNYEKKFKY